MRLLVQVRVTLTLLELYHLDGEQRSLDIAERSAQGLMNGRFKSEATPISPNDEEINLRCDQLHLIARWLLPPPAVIGGTYRVLTSGETPCSS
jgi:hypothetical protein